MTVEHLQIALITADFGSNSLGRTYCLWLLARHLGWHPTVVGVKGNEIWSPLAGSAFAEYCRLPLGDSQASRRVVEDQIAQSDVVIAVKPLGSSFGLAAPLAAAHGIPLIVDVDDPDLEVYTTWEPARRRIPRRLFSPHYRARARLRSMVRQHFVMVSNPVLQSMYGGTIIPHVRDVPTDVRSYQPSSSLTVRFVGSPRGHKGLPVLREAVGRVHGEGFRLGVTAAPPADAAPWEDWYGQTSLQDGLNLVKTADMIAVPSIAGGYSAAQLPVKLIDAMMFGRPIVASAFEPIRWALDGCGILVEPSDVDSLAGALLSLREVSMRSRLGHAARHRAVDVFSVEAVSPAFERVVAGVLFDRPDRACGGSE